MIAENFKNHDVFQFIDQLNKRLKAKDVRDTLDLETINYFKSVLMYLTQSLKQVNPTLVSNEELDSISNYLDSSIQQISTFIDTNRRAYLNNAQGSFDYILNKTKNLPSSLPDSQIDITNLVAGFEESLTGKYQALEEKHKEVLSQLENVESERDSILQDLEEYKSTLNKSFLEGKEQMEIDSGLFIQTLEEKRDEAQTLVNVIGNIGATGNFQEIANRHKSAANLWRWIAITLMVVTSIILIWSIFSLTEIELNWRQTISRILSASILIYPATYAARESSKHRKQEFQNRQAELELASINPFIEVLDDEKKQEVKAKLAEKYFGNGSAYQDDELKNIPVSAFEKIVSSLATIIHKK